MASVPRVTHREAEYFIRHLQEFRTSPLRTRHGAYYPDGSLQARDRLTGSGLLPGGWLIELRQSDPVYLVYSYDTPIAWVTSAGEYVVPDERYSVSTSQHQAIVRSAWGRGPRSQRLSDAELNPII